MTTIRSVCLGVGLLFASSLAASAQDKSCFDRLQNALGSGQFKGSQEQLLIPYIDYYQCLGRSPTEARAFALLRLQLAEAGGAYIAQKIKPSAYRAFIVDRQRKADRMRKSPQWADAIGRGDSDSDFVPDDLDRCPKSAAWSVTDDQGCELKCPAGDKGDLDAACAAQAPISGEAEGFLDPLVNVSVPINLACTDESPTTPALLAWGDRQHVERHGQFPGARTEITDGFYFTIRRTSPQPPDCEIWYAVQFVFRRPNASSNPPIKIQSVLFSSREDETAADETARLPVMTKYTRIDGDILRPTIDLPLSFGRRHLRDALSAYRDVSIRIRAITGGNRASAWSDTMAKARGPQVEDSIVFP